MFLVNQNYFVYLIILNVSQRTPGLCQTPDAENFAKVFTIKYFGKKFWVLMFDGVLNLSLHLPSIDFNIYVNIFILLLRISRWTLYIDVK